MTLIETKKFTIQTITPVIDKLIECFNTEDLEDAEYRFINWNEGVQINFKNSEYQFDIMIFNGGLCKLAWCETKLGGEYGIIHPNPIKLVQFYLDNGFYKVV
jgi:hypothetical protein